MLDVSKGEELGEWWVNTVNAAASFSTLEVWQEVLNRFFAPVLRRKLDPCRLVGNCFIDYTWPLFMRLRDVSKTETLLMRRHNSGHLEGCGSQEEMRWLLSGAALLWFLKQTTQTLGKSSLHVKWLLKTSRNGTESSSLTMCWGDRIQCVLSQWTYSPSIPPVLLQMDSTEWLFPPKEENFLHFFPMILLVVLPNLLFPTSQSLISSSGDCFQFLAWPGSINESQGSTGSILYRSFPT